jgi:hypothetical protein
MWGEKKTMDTPNVELVTNSAYQPTNKYDIPQEQIKK